ncbi:MAG: hypothetical protein H6712_03485 [Myxococcales bacterium]|nr:hypothetical protein [Myxococcales bacterium]MCB9712889.1 hypothetical protein [Myxococcales bacterium]
MGSLRRQFVTWILAAVAGIGGGSCAEEEDLGSFACGSEECDVRTELCSHDDCSEPNSTPPQCSDIPPGCDGKASSSCLNTGGRSCSERDGGGFDCSYACG